MATNQPKEVACFVHWGGQRLVTGVGNISYDGGRVTVVIANADTQFDDFVEEACNLLSIERNMLAFYFTTKHDSKLLIEMKSQQMFERMLRLNDDHAHVYVMDADGALEEHYRNVPHMSTRESNTNASTQPSSSPSVGPCGSFEGLEIGMIASSTAQIPNLKAVPLLSNPTAIEEGQYFPSPQVFKETLAIYALAHKFAYIFLDNSPKYYRLCCKVDGCAWKLTARCDGTTSMVRIIRFHNVHNHNAQAAATYKPTIRAKFIGPLVKEKLYAAPMYETRQICRDFQHDYSTSLSYSQAYRAKEWAKFSITGDPRDSFKFVPWMCNRLHEFIPGTRAEWTVTAEGHFKQLFVAYGPLIHGWTIACRPLLFIDACHLKGHYGGVLLSATGVDGNNGLYPLAYSFASGENDENWLWFLQQLHGIIQTREVVLMTDRNPSLLNSIIHEFHGHCNSWCLRHLKENFSCFLRTKGVKTVKKDAALKILNDIAYARDERMFQHHLGMMERFGTEFKTWVMDNKPTHWANALFPMKRWDWLSTNPAESFNAWIGDMRHMTIFQFMKAHVQKVTKFFADKRDEFEKWSSPVGKRIEEKIFRNQEYRFGHVASMAHNGQYNVLTSDNKQFAVDTTNHTCSCLEWQQSGIPCSHVMAVIGPGGFDVYDFVDDWFKSEKYALMLDHTLPAFPMHDDPTVEEISIGPSSFSVDANSLLPDLPLPPTCKRRPGRPRKKRIESQYQERRMLTCSRCRAPGHNCRNCKAALPGL